MKSSKKILGATAALGLAVALSAGSTFAWFAAGNKDVKINPFDLSVKGTTDVSTANLDIAVTTIGSTVTSGSFSAAANGSLAAFSNLELVPLTYDLTNKVLTDMAGVSQFNQDKTPNPSSVTGYITLRLVFRSSAPMDIYLKEDSAITPNGTHSNSIDISEALLGTTFYDAIDGETYGDKVQDDGSDYFTEVDSGAGNRLMEVTARAANASRVLFQNKATGGASAIWSPNEYYVGGGEEGTDVNESAENEEGQKTYYYQGFYNGTFAADYNYVLNQAAAGVAASSIDPDSNPHDTAETAVQKDYSSVALTKGEAGTVIATTSNEAAIRTMIGVTAESDTNYYAVVDMTIWIEGTDGDCISTILGDKLSVALNFVGKEKNA